MPAAVPAHRTYAFALFYAETQICECRLTPMGGAFLRRWAPPQSVRHASDLPPLISNAGSLATFVAMRRGSSAESRPAAFRRRRRSRRRRRASISAPSSAPAGPMATSSLMRSPTLTARSLEGSRCQVSHRGGRMTRSASPASSTEFRLSTPPSLMTAGSASSSAMDNCRIPGSKRSSRPTTATLSPHQREFPPTISSSSIRLTPLNAGQ